MKKHPSFKLFFVCCAVALVCGLAACASVAQKEVQMKIEQESVVIDAQGNSSKLQAGSNVTVVDLPLLVRSERRLPVFVVPVAQDQKEVTLNLPMIDDSVVGVADPKSISALLFSVQRIQKFVNEGALDQALAEVENRRREYPDVGYLMALEGSVRLLLRQKNVAITLYEGALARNPENAEIQDALQKLRREKSK